MSRYTWLLDPGHDGLGPGGEYLNTGKQSPDVPPGIYEGEFNRDVALRVEGMCKYRGIAAQCIVPGPINVSLGERVDYANAIHVLRENVIFTSIHANAMDGGWGDANGSVAFHFPGSVKGEKLAERIVHELYQHTPLSSRGVKESDFYVLQNTIMPAVLTEVAFMTNHDDAEYLALNSGRRSIADAYMAMIAHFEENGL